MTADTLRQGRALCGDVERARRHEWLCTNGLGGYAMGAVAGSLERSYHGLLIEATAPPLGRTLRLAKLDATLIDADGASYALDANAWGDGRTINPYTDAWLEGFHLDGGAPTWTFLIGGRRVQRALWMAHGAHTTLIRWRLLDEGPPLSLRLLALGSARSHHHRAGGGGAPVGLRAQGDCLEVAVEGLRPLRIWAPGAWEAGSGAAYEGFFLREEAARGLEARDAHRELGRIALQLTHGEDLFVAATVEGQGRPDGAALWAARQAREASLLALRAGVRRGAGADPARASRLVLSADAFVVTRPLGEGLGRTVMAGYPWFGDWGRDTMIALPGLLLATGRAPEAAQILRTFAAYEDGGMLPNRFPGAHEAPEYNTVDAALWFFEAAARTLAALPEAEAAALRAALWPVLERIVAAHRAGTRYGIRVAEDGLVTAGEAGVQLTWMDARVGERVITPRMGKPVEINGLWLRALEVLLALRRAQGAPDGDLPALLERARGSFARYWDDARGHLYDVLDGPHGDDGALRPNQVIALSLPGCPLSPERRRRALSVVRARLLTSHGLRSLDPSDPHYEGVYHGSPSQRDGVYHQGTTWGWLIGPWIEANLLAGASPDALRRDLEGLWDHLSEGVLGSASEIFDGDPPFLHRGAPAQAWSVAALMQAHDALEAAAAGLGGDL